MLFLSYTLYSKLLFPKKVNRKKNKLNKNIFANYKYLLILYNGFSILVNF